MSREPYVIVRPLEYDCLQLTNLLTTYEFVFIAESVPFKFNMKNHLPGMYHVEVIEGDTYYVPVTHEAYLIYHGLAKTDSCCVVL